MKPLLFGKYCLLERISVGGMAEVFRAKPLNTPEFKGYLALKRILPHLAEDEEFITMFVDEARLTVQLQHPNIVRIYELGQFQTSYYILMEFIAGKDVLTLQKRVRKRKETIGIANSLYIAQRIAEGLDFAHRKTGENGQPLNIIHRDISPQNVLVDYLGDVKVIDFGIAKAAVQSSRTQVGVLKGKMGYMSPEQVQGLPLDHRSDVFAIGTVLWEMLTNKRLFNGENEFETMRLVKACEVPAPSELNPEVPPEIDQIVLGALQSDREQRYQSAGHLAQDLQVWAAHLGGNADRLSNWMREVFAEDLEEELEKREEYGLINTAEDVRRLSLPESGHFDMPDEDDGPKTEIWAGEPPSPAQDDVAFGAEHTVVQAGGFDISQLDLIEIEDNIRELKKGPPPLPASVTGAHQRVSSDFSAEGTRRTFVPQESKKDKRVYFLGAAALVLFFTFCVASAALLYQLVNKDEAPSVDAGSVILSVTPSENVEILLNSVKQTGELPLRIDYLGEGVHVVEARAPGFETAKVEVEVKPDTVIPLAIELKPALKEGTIQTKLPTLTALRVWVNGEERDINDVEPSFRMPVGVVLFEVTAPDWKPFRAFLELEDGAEISVEPRLEPVGFDLNIEGERNSVVRLDSKRLGVVPVKIDKLNPLDLHTLEVTNRGGGEGVSRWENFVGLPLLAEETLVADFNKPREVKKKRDYGALVLDTGKDWWSVWVEGVDTGLITPITKDRSLPLLEGKYTIRLKRGYQEETLEIEVVGGETLEIAKDLPFQYKP